MDRRYLKLCKFGAALTCGLILVSAGTSFAAKAPGGDSQNTGQAATEATTQGANAESGTTFGNLTITANTDEKYCLSGGVQCTTTGHTAAAVANTNHNPARIVFQVLSGTTPVTGLTSAAFTIFNPFVPAGGSSAVLLACASCFQSVGSGMYAIFVHPSSSNWKSGTYHIQLRVQVGATGNKALARIDVP